MKIESKNSTKYGLVDQHTGAWLSAKSGQTSADDSNALVWGSADDAKAALADMIAKYSPDRGHGRLGVAQLSA